jgi:hypothetical protein
VAKRNRSEVTDEGNGVAVVQDLRRAVQFTIEGVAPYSQGRMLQSKRRNKEDADLHDEQHWRERIHRDGEGRVVIPSTSLYLALLQTAKFRGEKFKGNKTYADRFAFGIMAEEDAAPVQPEVHVDDVQMELLNVPSDGKPAYEARGQSKRVPRRFPYIPVGWKASFRFYVFDEAITEDVFLNHLKDAGLFIGIGRWRPACRGRYGRFRVVSAKWELI